MDYLYTPWRLAYIRKEKKPVDGCVFCNKRHAQNDAHDYIIARSEHVYVIMNIFPYNSGHVMVVPYEHLHSQEQMSPEALMDLMLTVNRTLAVIRRAYNPPAFNLGVNLGEAAGAGIAAHYHFHIVPRWGGDANFMTVVGTTRVIPGTLDSIYADLLTAWQALYGGNTDSPLEGGRL
jgi:ATP adenylyltransferase